MYLVVIVGVVVRVLVQIVVSVHYDIKSFHVMWGVQTASLLTYPFCWEILVLANWLNP